MLRCNVCFYENGDYRANFSYAELTHNADIARGMHLAHLCVAVTIYAMLVLLRLSNAP